MNEQHQNWATILAEAYEQAGVRGKAVQPTPIVVGPPADFADGAIIERSVVHESDADGNGEVVPEGLLGWAWVEIESDGSGQGDAFVAWLTGDTDTEHPPTVPVHTYSDAADPDGEREIVRIDIQNVGDSVEPVKAAADWLANWIENNIAGVRTTAVQRLN